MKVKRIITIKKRSDGSKHRLQSKKWYAVFKSNSDTIARIPLFTDRKASEELSRKIDRMKSHRVAGEPLPSDLLTCLESLPSGIRSRLVKTGVIELRRVAAGQPLTEHVQDWEQFLYRAVGPRFIHEPRVVVSRKSLSGAGFPYGGTLTLAQSRHIWRNSAPGSADSRPRA